MFLRDVCASLDRGDGGVYQNPFYNKNIRPIPEKQHRDSVPENARGRAVPRFPYRYTTGE
jgi:hypothetical protein